MGPGYPPTGDSCSHSLKMLHGAGKPIVLTWVGLTLQDNAPELLTILDSNKYITIKFYGLEPWLKAAQQ